MIKTVTIETAAVANLKAVKKGSAEKGAVVCGANENALGIISGNDFGESFAVGEDAPVRMAGESAIWITGTTVTAGDSLQCMAGGLASVMQIVNGSITSVGAYTVSHAFRVARALENGIPNEAIEVLVTNDVVTTIA